MKRTCPSCGKGVDDQSRFCGYCGYDFNEKPRQTMLGMSVISPPEGAEFSIRGPSQKTTQVMTSVSAEELASASEVEISANPSGSKNQAQGNDRLRVGLEGGPITLQGPKMLRVGRQPNTTQPIKHMTYDVEVSIPTPRQPEPQPAPQDKPVTPLEPISWAGSNDSETENPLAMAAQPPPDVQEGQKATLLLAKAINLDTIGQDMDGWPSPEGFDGNIDLDALSWSDPELPQDPSPKAADAKAPDQEVALADTLEGSRAEMLAEIHRASQQEAQQEPELAAPQQTPSEPAQDAIADTLEANRAAMLKEIEDASPQPPAAETGRAPTVPAQHAVPDAALMGTNTGPQKPAATPPKKRRPQAPTALIDRDAAPKNQKATVLMDPKDAPKPPAPKPAPAAPAHHAEQETSGSSNIIKWAIAALVVMGFFGIVAAGLVYYFFFT